MTKNLTRKNFLAASAVTAGLVGLAGCTTTTVTSDTGPAEETGDETGEETGGDTTVTSNTGPAEDVYAAPDASAYPIDPDGSDVTALFETEEVRDGWTKATNPNGTEIGTMNTAKIIQVDGLAFRDMNGNGKLDLWEDWRQSVDDRAAALAESLSAEDIFPLMWAGGADSGSSTATDTSSFDWAEQGSRAGVSRLTSTIDSYATDVAWINSVQQLCEESDNGIPYLNYSDPYVLFEVPSSVGLAACMDKDMWRKAGMWQARAWRATGVRCELGPQIDVYSNPIGTRLSGSVCEDPAINRDFAAAFAGGMQSTWGDDEATDDLGWGKESCAVMLKHYVGEGSNEGGRDDHSDSGKWNVFPGSNFNAHLVPFLDGGLNLDSSTKEVAAMMPCYGIAVDPNDPDALGEHVGSAYSTHNISILRNAGWDGMLCTDWMIVSAIPHGVLNLTEAERYAKLLNNTISQEGGEFSPDLAEESYQLMCEESGEDEALATIRENARRIFKVMLNVELFENPYSDRTVAKSVLESEAAAAFGAECNDKCVVMLKNAGNVISSAGLGDSPKVYIPQRYTPVVSSAFGDTPASIGLAFDESVASEYFGDFVTDTVADSDEVSEDSITRLTADDLADVQYAVIAINNPNDAYQGVQGGPSFATVIMGAEPEDGPYWKPLSLQYRPFTADGDYVRKESLNPEDEYGEYINRSVYGESTYATNESDLDLVIDVKSKLPEGAKLILVIDADRPMCFYEIEPYADVILMGFDGIAESSFARVITGEVEPSGLLTFQMPIDMQTVFEQLEDVPRDMECYTDSEGNTYDFCFGLNWSGVIDDDRVATYKVNPVTEPETTVTPDA